MVFSCLPVAAQTGRHEKTMCFTDEKAAAQGEFVSHSQARSKSMWVSNMGSVWLQDPHFLPCTQTPPALQSLSFRWAAVRNERGVAGNIGRMTPRSCCLCPRGLHCGWSGIPH